MAALHTIEALRVDPVQLAHLLGEIRIRPLGQAISEVELLVPNGCDATLTGTQPFCN